MSLRTRLGVTLGLLFLLPLVVGVLMFAVVLPDARAEQVVSTARTSAAAVAAELADTCATVALAVRNPALEAGSRPPGEALATVVDGGYVDYAAFLRDDGSVLVDAGDRPEGVADLTALPTCSARDEAAPVLAERVPVSGVTGAAEVVALRDLGGPLLEQLRLRGSTDGQVVLLDGSQVLASTVDQPLARRLAAAADAADGVAEVDGWTVVEQPPDAVPVRVLVAQPPISGGIVALPVVLVGGLATLAAGLLVALVARSLSKPFTTLTEVAERVAHGDLDTEVAVDEEGEAGRLGSALNTMIDGQRRNLAELERSRQELRDSLERIGDTLSATHDLDGLLQVVLDTAQATVGSDAAVVLHRTGDGDKLQLVAEQGLHEADLPAPAVVDTGVGVLGQVFASGSPVRGRIGSGPADLDPGAHEPATGEVLAVPLRSMGAIVGVLALYGRSDGRPFDDTDQDALGTLATQAGIAMDNVHLHQEAQRLSTTDGLTGIWNFRYLSMSLAREIERSTRFDRPLAVLMLDLDHFKAVNDTHGHQRGDAVLRELAERVQEQIREVDTFARYGGEEFAVVLPETTVEGAAQLADRICVAVRRAPFCSEGEEPLDITISVGGAAFPHHGSSPATLMRAADKALYVAKAEGRDRWHVPELADG